jgi:hypothetical protein
MLPTERTPASSKPAPAKPAAQPAVSSPQPPLTTAAATERYPAEAVTSAVQQILGALTQKSETLPKPEAQPPLVEAFQSAYDQDGQTPAGSGVEQMLAAYGAPAPETSTVGKGDTLEEMLRDRRALRSEALEGGRGDRREYRIINQLRKLNAPGSTVYEHYTPTQQAAVDFNRMLVEAVHKDRKLQDKYDSQSDLQRTEYDDAISRMFGEDRGSETFAPETVALLTQLGYSDPNADLDDFLSLKAGIGRKNIEAMAAHQAPAPAAPGVETAPGLSVLDSMNPEKKDRFDLAKSLAHTTEQMEATIARSNKVLSSFSDTARVDRNDLLDKFGGRKNKPEGGVGYEAPGQLDANGNATDLNTYFQQAFDMLANKKVDSEAVLADARSVLSPGSLKQFMAYLDDRSSYAERYGMPLGQGNGAEYRSPGEFRKLLGLDKGASDA